MVSWMDIESCRFIYDHESRIFVEDFELWVLSCVIFWYRWFCEKWFYLILSQMNIYSISELDTVCLIHFFSIYLYFSSAEPFINTPQRCFRKIFFDKFIDSLISIWWMSDVDRTQWNEWLLEHGEVECSIRGNLWKLYITRTEKSVWISLCVDIHILGWDRFI